MMNNERENEDVKMPTTNKSEMMMLSLVVVPKNSIIAVLTLGAKVSESKSWEKKIKRVAGRPRPTSSKFQRLPFRPKAAATASVPLPGPAF